MTQTRSRNPSYLFCSSSHFFKGKQNQNRLKGHQPDSSVAQRSEEIMTNSPTSLSKPCRGALRQGAYVIEALTMFQVVRIILHKSMAGLVRSQPFLDYKG